jgi:hypothetical protein
MKTKRRGRNIAPLILQFDSIWRLLVKFTTRPLWPLGKKFLCPLNRRLCGPQNRFGGLGKEKNILPTPGFENRTVQSVVQSLYWLLFRILFITNCSPWLLQGSELNFCYYCSFSKLTSLYVAVWLNCERWQVWLILYTILILDRRTEENHEDDVQQLAVASHYNSLHCQSSKCFQQRPLTSRIYITSLLLCNNF